MTTLIPSPLPLAQSTSRQDQLRSLILDLVSEYHAEAFRPKPFKPGESAVPVSGKVFDHHEMRQAVEAGLDFWLTSGRFTESFERRFARYFGVRDCLLVNSGSSANLVALSALTSPKLGERQLQPGDEVITAACGFPTTVNPILQNGLLPVFVDVHIPSYNLDVRRLEAALSRRSKAIMVAHTLGNPFDLDAIADFAKRRGLWLIEDCCDAVGAKWNGQMVGTFGDLATTSFYPAHHITMGEGGAVLTRSAQLKSLVESYRDWGRDCWCPTGKDNTCGKRFDWQLGDLPCGYDHKYTYSHIGYNLKATDFQAAIGCAQLDKLPAFIEARQRNFEFLRDGLSSLSEYLELPESLPGAEPSWFGFPLAVRDASPKSRNEIVAFLENRRIATRLLFGGNLTKQPAYAGAKYRVAGTLENCDRVMNTVFWIGLYPGLDSTMLSYMVESFHAAFRA